SLSPVASSALDFPFEPPQDAPGPVSSGPRTRTTRRPTMTAESATQTLGFQAEVKQLLKLMIHSLYSHKEIFLRELISNASDACDKLRFEALANPELLAGESELGITIDADDKAHTVTITDNGIGMTRAEAIEHLGTIAKSGTAEFLAKLSGDQ